MRHRKNVTERRASAAGEIQVSLNHDARVELETLRTMENGIREAMDKHTAW